MPLNDLLIDLPPRPTPRNGVKPMSEGSMWLIEIHPDPVVITIDAAIAYANSPAIEMFGARSADEILGRSLIDFSSADRYDVLERFLAETDDQNEILALRHEIVQLNGDWRIVETHAKEIAYQGTSATLIVFHDVTERRRSLDGPQAVTNSISEGVCRIEFSGRISTSEDPGVQARQILERGRVQQTNNQMAAVMGLSDRNQLKDRPLRMLLRDDGPIRAFVNSGYRLKNHELTFNLANGGRRYVMLSAVGIVEGGEIQHIWGSCIDVTERVSLERRMVGMLEKQQHEIGRELHDGVGQILTGVNILGDVLCDRLVGNDDAYPIAKSLLQYASDAAAQIRTIYQGLTPVQIEREHLVCLLEELVMNTNKIPNVTCRFVHDGETDVYSGDAKLHLYRIAQEAVNNALKHANADHIVVSLMARNDDIILSIEDDGQGLNGHEKAGRRHFEGESIRGQDVRGQSVRGQSGRGQGVRGERVRGQNGHVGGGQNGHGQNGHGQNGRGQIGHVTAHSSGRNGNSTMDEDSVDGTHVPHSRTGNGESDHSAHVAKKNGSGRAQSSSTSLGMDSMRYRANAIYGTLDVGPSSRGGTRVSCRICRATAGVVSP